MILNGSHEFNCSIEEWTCKACGIKWAIDDINPQETRINFCPNCGHNENDDMYFYRPFSTTRNKINDMMYGLDPSSDRDEVVAILYKKRKES